MGAFAVEALPPGGVRSPFAPGAGRLARTGATGRVSSFLRSSSIAAAWRSITIRPSAAPLSRRALSRAFSSSERRFFVSISRSRASICPIRASDRLTQTASADPAPASFARTPPRGGGASLPPAENQAAKATSTAAARLDNRSIWRLLIFRLSGSIGVFPGALIAPLSFVRFRAPPRRSVRPRDRSQAPPPRARPRPARGFAPWPGCRPRGWNPSRTRAP